MIITRYNNISSIIMTYNSSQRRYSNNIRERVSLLLTVVRESLEHGAGSRELVGYVVSSERREGVWIEVEPPHPLLPLQGLGQHSIYCPPHYLVNV